MDLIVSKVIKILKEKFKWRNLTDSDYEIIGDVFVRCLSELSVKIAELEAKVYAYEQIIANSNFEPVLKPYNTRKEVKCGEHY